MSLATRLIRGLLAAAILWAIALAVCGRTDLLMLHAFPGTGSVHANLPGYGEYAARARFRLLPGVW
jgi:hypothetical protein